MFDDIWNEAIEAAKAAHASCKPHPVIFGQAKDLFSNEFVPGTEERCDDGVCGVAYMTIRPARGPFVAWMKKNRKGDSGVYGGWTISPYDLDPSLSRTQSMERKEAAMRAAREIFAAYFPTTKFSVQSRMT